MSGTGVVGSVGLLASLRKKLANPFRSIRNFFISLKTKEEEALKPTPAAQNGVPNKQPEKSEEKTSDSDSEPDDSLESISLNSSGSDGEAEEDRKQQQTRDRTSAKTKIEYGSGTFTSVVPKPAKNEEAAESKYVFKNPTT